MKKSYIARIATCLAALFFLPFWYCEKFIKRDCKIWLFGSMNCRTDSDNCYAFFEYVNKHCKDVRAVWVTRYKSVYEKLHNQGYNVEMSDSKEGRKVCLHAGYAFISQGAAETNKKYINGIKQIFLWHGMPMKIIGKDSEKFENQKLNRIEKAIKRFEKFSMPYLFNNKPDIFISSSEFFARIFSSAFGVKEENIISIGQPRDDVFFSNKSESIINQLNTRYNNPLKIFFMPTFRDNLIAQGKQFNPFDDFGFSTEKFNDFLEKNKVVFLFKGHNHEGIINLTNKLCDRFVVITPENCSDPYTLLKDIDILMTDYSSVYFDFLLLKKPIILSVFDYDSYIVKSRPFNFDYKTTIEGCMVNNWNEFIEVVENQKYNVPSENTIKRFHTFVDGNNCERLLNYIKEL